jgi:sulfatase modifying factor 1
LNQFEVSNQEYEYFVNATQYVSESEKFGWSFVFHSAVPQGVYETLTQAVLGAEWWLPVNGSYWRSPEGPGTDVFATNRSRLPVVQVSWTDAAAFCAWRGGRLPSEAEWEVAAQGTGVGRTALFPWGSELVSPADGARRCNTYQGRFPDKPVVTDGFEFLAPVDSFGPQNEYQLYNMIGNAWEWVSDWFQREHIHSHSHSHSDSSDSSARGVLDNPIGPAAGKEKVKKGGSFLCHRKYCYRYRTAARYFSTPDSASLNTGFRCAKDSSSRHSSSNDNSKKNNSKHEESVIVDVGHDENYDKQALHREEL